MVDYKCNDNKFVEVVRNIASYLRRFSRSKSLTEMFLFNACR